MKIQHLLVLLVMLLIQAVWLPREAPDPSAGTETPAGVSTEAPTEEETEAPTEASTEAPTEEETEAPTEASTEAPTEAPTQPAVPPAQTSYYPPLSPYASAAELKARARQLHAEKTVYITFDDGPSNLTPHLLDMLDWYGVKATFFVVYRPELESVYREILARGHAIGIHCTSHDYSQVYGSFEMWKRDFDQMYYYLTQVIGYTPRLYRFPGGSYRELSWMNQAVAYLNYMGVVFWDWNVIMEGGSTKTTKEEILANAADGLNRTLPVILCHDGTGMDLTVSCVPEVLWIYLSRGYTFRVLDAGVPPIQSGDWNRWDY